MSACPDPVQLAERNCIQNNQFNSAEFGLALVQSAGSVMHASYNVQIGVHKESTKPWLAGPAAQPHFSISLGPRPGTNQAFSLEAALGTRSSSSTYSSSR